MLDAHRALVIYERRGMRCADVKALHTIFAVSGLNLISAVSQLRRIALNLCDEPIGTPLFASNSVCTK